MTAPAVGDGGTETFALAFGKDPNRPLFLRLVHSLPASRAAEMADAGNRDRFAREIVGVLLPDYRVTVAYRLSGHGTPVFTFTVSDLSLPEPDERAVVPQPGSHLLHIVDKSAIPVRKLRSRRGGRLWSTSCTILLTGKTPATAGRSRDWQPGAMPA